MDAWTSKPVLTCRSCGAELPSDARFCWVCGATVHAGSESEQLDEAAAARELHSLIRSAHHYEKYYDDRELKRFLARFPAAVNVSVGKERQTALHVAAFGDPEQDAGEDIHPGVNRRIVMDALLEVPEPDVNARDWEGNTPLHTAIFCCPQLPPGNEDYDADFLDRFMLRVQQSVITGLLNLGADPDAVNQNGQTPMHLAAERGRNHVLYHLMCLHGGDPHTLDKRRWSPVHYATQYGYTHVLNLIDEELQDRAMADQPAPLPEPLTRNTD